jgi:hypothetical protein
MRTPEMRARVSAGMKASWVKRRQAKARRARAAAECEAQARPTAATLEKAIAYHQSCLTTLLAAKALLK